MLYINRDIFFSKVRKSLFKGRLTEEQVSGIDRILSEWEKRVSDGSFSDDLRHLGYLLATVYHETAYRMVPVREGGGERYLRSKRYYPWVGEGLVQVTWEANARKFGAKKPGDLMSWPIALEAAFRGMRDGVYTGKKLSTYFNTRKDDPINARRIINGTDKAKQIAGYHKKFMDAIRPSLADDERETVPLPKPRPHGADKPEPVDDALLAPETRQDVSRPHGQQSGYLEVLQWDLKGFGYYEVGNPDGKWGGKTAGAIEAFRNDRHLPAKKVIDESGIDEELLAEIREAKAEGWTRPISKTRSEATPEDVIEKTEKPGEAVKASTWTERLAAWALGIPAAVAAFFKGVLEKFETAKEWVSPVTDVLGDVPVEYYLIGVGGIALLLFLQSRRSKNAITSAYQNAEIN